MPMNDESELMKIILIAPNYPSKYTPVGTTPVVHYFAREWVKMGHEVVVFHLETKYPFFIYWGTRLFGKKIYSKRGSALYTKSPKDYQEVVDGVNIFHIVVNKFFPSPRFSKEQVDRAYAKVFDYCNQTGPADVFIGHWDNPQLEILNRLKKAFPARTTALVLHSLIRDLNVVYPDTLKTLFDGIDIIGFRSIKARLAFQEKYFTPSRSFIASSGVSDLFIKNAKDKTFDKGVKNFIFVGSLLQRKHPREILMAVSSVYGDSPYKVTYVGDGDEINHIKRDFERLSGKGEIELTGRLKREEIIEYLKRSDVFVMISYDEVFGLVYMEAMAMGCITVASVGSGVDGIIKDGENGFLCRPGDEKHLEEVIASIRKLSKEELNKISRNAVKTALMYSDYNVAATYLDSVTS